MSTHVEEIKYNVLVKITNRVSLANGIEIARNEVVGPAESRIEGIRDWDRNFKYIFTLLGILIILRQLSADIIIILHMLFKTVNVFKVMKDCWVVIEF